MLGAALDHKLWLELHEMKSYASIFLK